MAPINAVKATSSATEGDRFSVRRPHVIRGIFLTLALFMTSVAVGGSGALGADSNGVMFGAFASPRGSETQITAVTNLEKNLGTKLPLVRGFERWDSNINNRFNNWVVDGNRTLFLSIKAERKNGQDVTWRSIANAQPGSTIHNEMVELARDVRALDGEVWITFHHEPEAKTELAYGTNSDFKAAWRKFHNVFNQQGADVQWVWTMTSWSFEVDTADRRSAGKWYPGDDVVDYLGADPYNFAQCRENQGEKWVSLERVIAPFVEFGKKHPTKKLVLPEFASHDPGGSQKANWFDELRTYMKKPGNADRFAAIVYFHDNDANIPRCKWVLDSSSSSLDAAGRLARDPYFSRRSLASGGGTVAAPAPTTTTTTTAAPAPTPTVTTAPAPAPTPAGEITLNGGCKVEAVDGSFDRVTWTPQGGRFQYNVRRNDKWLASVGKNTWFINTKHTSGTYEIVARDGRSTGRFTCRRAGAAGAAAPQPVATPTLTAIPAIGGCRVDRMEGSDRVTWPPQGSGFTYQVFHNGKQIATTTNTWHWNRNIQSGDYVVKAFKDNSVATLNCRRR